MLRLSNFIFILFLIFIAGCNTVAINTNPTSTDGSAVVVQQGDSQQLDSFGRQRVSLVTSLLDIKMLNGDQELFIDEELNGTATTTFVNSTMQMETSASGDYVVRQTFQRGYYQNGKSQQILMTFDSFEPQTNIEKRVGYYSSDTVAPYNTGLDGLFLSSNSSGVYVNVYKGGEKMYSIPQSEWNVDKLDGTGSSGININWSKSQILEMDYEWLGVGRIRFALVVDGQIIDFHHINNANSIQGVYMLSPNQPVRWEIRQTGAGSGQFNHICTSVGTEGALNSLGVERSINNGDTAVQANTAGTSYNVIGIRLNESQQNEVIDVLRFSLLARTNDNFYWELHLNPTLSTTPTYTQIEHSSIQYFLNSGTITDAGVVLDSGYGLGRSTASDVIDNALRMGVDLNGNSDVMVLSVTPLSNGLDIYGSLTYREVR